MKIIFKCRTREKSYYIDKAIYCGMDYGHDVEVEPGNILSEEIIEETDIGSRDNLPNIEVGDWVYIESLKEERRINEIITSSSGNMIYYLNDKLVETDASYEKWLKLVDECAMLDGRK